MKPAYFAILLNIGIFVVAIVLVQTIPFLGAIACLASYPGFAYLGYILAKYPLNISVSATDADPKPKAKQASTGQRKSRLRELDQ